MSTKHPNSFSNILDGIFGNRCITVFFIIFAFFSPFLIHAYSASAASSSTATSQMPLKGYCNNPNPQNPHCYAEIYWQGGTGGAYTQIDPYGALNC